MPTAAQGSPTPASSSSPQDRAQQFVPVAGGTEQTSASAMLLTAYVLLWIVLFLFVFLGWRRQRRLDERIAYLEGALKRAADDES